MPEALNNIIEGCIAGNIKHQEQLYKHCYNDMTKVCKLYAFNVDDVSILYNQAMLKVLTNIRQYKGQGDLMAWVRRIVVNVCIDNCRGKATYELKELNEQHENEMFSHPEVYNAISAKEIMLVIKELPINTGLVFNMYVMEGYKHHEIAERLKIPIGSSKWYLNEARKLLKQKLDSLLTKKSYVDAIG
ncbi:MAG: RNA polymerase sigma factor [Bacteroidota bacterium]